MASIPMDEQRNSTRKRGYVVAGLLLAIGGVVFFSLRPIFIKLAYAWVTDPVTLLALRMGLGLLRPFEATGVGESLDRGSGEVRDVIGEGEIKVGPSRAAPGK